MVLEVTRYKKGGQVEKRRPGIKMAEKGPKKFSRFMRHFPTTLSLNNSPDQVAVILPIIMEFQKYDQISILFSPCLLDREY